LALVLTALFTLAPATRWGYFVYPGVIGCFLWLAGLSRPGLSRPGLSRPAGTGTRGPEAQTAVGSCAPVAATSSCGRRQEGRASPAA
jgi:hypothetical protein